VLKTARLGAILIAMLVLSVRVVDAQQPAPSNTQRPGMMDMPGMAAHMRTLDSLDARLDTLVERMNRTTGTRKVAAMADVINELVTQRKLMQAHMRQMMESHRGMMPMRGGPSPHGAMPRPRTDSGPAGTAP
jgi:predicted transcriptional regulator